MKIYQTFRNADDVEGRGPMIPDLAFLHYEHAAEYVDSQPGIMGRKGKWSEDKYGDWYIREVEVLEYNVVEAKERKERIKEEALSKLTDEEREVLGL